MEYKHVTADEASMIRRRTDEALSDDEPVKLNPQVLARYIQEFERMAANIDYLSWFHKNADFGPAHSDVVMHMQRHYRIGTGRDIPQDWVYE